MGLWHSTDTVNGQNLLSGKVARICESLLKHQEMLKVGLWHVLWSTDGEMSGERMTGFAGVFGNLTLTEIFLEASNLANFGCALLRMTKGLSLTNRPCMMPKHKRQCYCCLPTKWTILENVWWLVRSDEVMNKQEQFCTPVTSFL